MCFNGARCFGDRKEGVLMRKKGKANKHNEEEAIGRGSIWRKSVIRLKRKYI